MVQKKIKSKRIPTNLRARIARKVHEHNRKLKRNNKKTSASKPKPKVNTAIPKTMPFLNETLEEIKQTKELLNKKPELNGPKPLTDGEAMELLLRKTMERQEEYNNTHHEEGENASLLRPNQNRHNTYFRELKKVIELSDVILILLDSRDPLGSRSNKVEKLINEANSTKRIVFVLTKIDLVPKNIVLDWLKYLRHEHPTIAFINASRHGSTRKESAHLGLEKSPDDNEYIPRLPGSHALGASDLINILKNYCRNNGHKQSITVGIVGCPNVGKSSLINTLKSTPSCEAGPTPGLTRNLQEIKLDKDIKLIDSPGVIMDTEGISDPGMIIRHCLKIEKIEDPIGAINSVLDLVDKEKLVNYYSMETFETVTILLQSIATKSGFLQKGGILNLEQAARRVLGDISSGKIPYYMTAPIRSDSEASSRIVEGWAKEFELADLDNSSK